MASSQSKPSERVVPKEVTLSGRIIARLLWLLVNLLAFTIRFRWRDDSGHFEKNPEKPAIFCIWHNRLALSLTLYQRHVKSRWRQRTLAVLISASRDGGLISRVLELFKGQPIRGSSSRRGAQALREAVGVLRENLDLAITPDGPRGPRYAVQSGIITIAQLSGCPIIPVNYNLRWKKELKSWDRFQIPLPFSRCDVRLGKTVEVPRQLSEDERESIRASLEETMHELTLDD